MGATLVPAAQSWQHRMMIASYSADLAEDHGRWIRDAIYTWGDDLGIQLKTGSQAANRIDIVGGEGGLLAAGIGGGLTGRGAHIAIVDDPVKDMADTDSSTMRKRAGDWRTFVLQTRLEPTGPICVIQTRWHEDDLAGRILATERDAWRVIDLPALADTPDDSLGRAPGEPLRPQRFDAAYHARTCKRVGQRVWGTRYMQKPRPPEGGVWKRKWIDTARINAVQVSGIDMARIVVSVDAADGESTVGDQTGVIGVGRDFDRQFYVLADRSGSMGANDWALPPADWPSDSSRRHRGGEELWRRHGEADRHPGMGAATPRGSHQGPCSCR